MIQFRCPRCGQKLAVHDEGVGAIISCTTCMENILVPVHTDAEFQRAARTGNVETAVPVKMELVRAGHDGKQSGQDGVQEAEERAAMALRGGLLPHLARMMMSRLVQALISQRAHLLDSQQAASVRVQELEARLGKVQENLQKRLASYENRIADLERQLAIKEEENRELIRAKFLLAKKALETEAAKQTERVDLRDAGFLLRA